MHDSLKVSGELSVNLRPGAQARDWKQRWIEIQAHLDRVCEPHTECMSGPAIQTAQHELRSLLVQAYHLKDAPKHEATSTGVSGQTVEAAITNDPHLALLADLCNLEKHAVINQLQHPPRSGHLPVYGEVSGTTVPGGWRLSLEIQHNGRTLDGITVACQAVSAWETQLQAWGLI